MTAPTEPASAPFRKRRLPTQAEVLAWVAARWPDYTTVEWRAMKVGEEAGEVLGAVIKASLGLKPRSEIEVESGQTFMCLLALAAAEGFDLYDALADEWERCATRTWPGDQGSSDVPLRPFCNTWPFAASDLDLVLARGCCDGWLPVSGGSTPIPTEATEQSAAEHRMGATAVTTPKRCADSCSDGCAQMCQPPYRASRKRRLQRKIRDVKRFPGTVRRWRTDRCEECGRSFRWKRDSRNSFGSRDGKVWHDKCISLVIMRTKAAERLAVLDLVTDVWGITMGDATELMANRAEKENYERSNAWNLAWRVFYDLDNERKAKANA